MTREQLKNGERLQRRIYELAQLEHHMNLKDQEKIFIQVDFFSEKIKIPEHSKEVILAMCAQEREKLEKEFENL